MRLEIERHRATGKVKLKLPLFQDGRDDMDMYLTTFERLMTVQKYPENA